MDFFLLCRIVSVQQKKKLAAEMSMTNRFRFDNHIMLIAIETLLHSSAILYARHGYEALRRLDYRLVEKASLRAILSLQAKTFLISLL